ncbi:hypothetical protein Dda_3485 [Drechslerella dactyloides]|uniref:WSC domain-containing protein n=1 Tax=Drechslerella dactyloides TaxID=74499 RepID=A0AAD6NMV9_DREDA|nr:hypothetical protein Dda_3485 [Drechslerella dactyloides]
MVFAKVVLASAALLPAVLASSLDTSSSQLSKRTYEPHYPVCPYAFTDWEYVDCYNDPDGKTLRFNPKINGPDMTIEKCWAACKGNGYRYAGLEYYSRCGCGNEIDGTPYVDGGDVGKGCNAACAGNTDQICGGSKAISVYRDPTFPTDVDLNTAGTGYDSIGCFAEVPGKLLTDDQDIDKNAMTPELCLSTCGKQGYAYAGLEYGQECYCAPKLAPGAVSSEKCTMKCKGDSNQLCGGSSAVQVYYNSDLESIEPCGPPPNGGTTTTTTTTTPPPETTTTTTTTEEPTTTTTTEETTTTTTTEEPTTTTTNPTTTSRTTTTRTTTTRRTTTRRTTTRRTTTTTTRRTTTTTSCRTRCGGYCAPPLPTFTNPSSCRDVNDLCWKQIDDCNRNGYGDACSQLIASCAKYAKYCKTKCNGNRCNKNDCDGWDGHYNPPRPTPRPTKSCRAPVHTVPSSTNACATPTGYPNPVGGCKAPVVSCNDDRDDYNRGKCYKVFVSKKKNECGSYGRNDLKTACLDACKSQYDNCRVQYAGSTNKPRMNKYRNKYVKRSDVSESAELSKRTFGYYWSWIGSNNYNTYNSACDQCKKQYDACVDAQKNVNGNNYCKKYGVFR